MAMMEAPVRVRVVFDERHLLTKSQRSEGLRRCWLLLRPDLATVGDLADHVARCFRLKRSCPDGIVLAMDEFVLPSFESTCIFRDMDIIRVRKKGGKEKMSIEQRTDAYFIQDSDNVVKHLMLSNNKLLAISQFKEDSGAHKSKDGEDACSLPDNAILLQTPSSEDPNLKKKRRRSDKSEGSKRKKSKLNSLGKVIASTDRDDNIRPVQTPGCSQSGRFQTLNVSQAGVDNNQTTTSVPTEVRHNQIEENDQINTCLPCGSISTKKHSRSACRKKLKRQLRRKMANHQRKEDMQSLVPANDMHETSPKHQAVGQIVEIQEEIVPTVVQPGHICTSPKHQAVGQIVEMEEEIVPIVVRPGHIRFEPVGTERTKLQSNGLVELLQWNGTTSKKKGQKWGRDNTFNRWSRDNASNEASNKNHIAENGDLHGTNSRKGQKWAQEKTFSRWNGDNACNGSPNKKFIAENGYLCGSTSKKGQKWGRQKTFSRWNGGDITCSRLANENLIAENGDQHRTTSKKVQNWSRQKTFSRWNDYNADGEVSNIEIIAGKGKILDDHVNFETLFPLTRAPKEGDVVVYRLVELSSSWCPEVSPFRVGKVSLYDSITMKIILVPVPEYPLFSDEEKDAEESYQQPHASLYKEDGSLEIDYPSLVDVRLLKASDLGGMTSNTSRETTKQATQENNWEAALASTTRRDPAAPVIERRPNTSWDVVDPVPNEKAQPGQKDGWAQIDEALNEKKAQLQKDGWDCWTQTNSTNTNSWSYRALRRSALGPTVALLRAKGGKYSGGK